MMISKRQVIVLTGIDPETGLMTRTGFLMPSGYEDAIFGRISTWKYHDVHLIFLQDEKKLRKHDYHLESQHIFFGQIEAIPENNVLGTSFHRGTATCTAFINPQRQMEINFLEQNNDLSTHYQTAIEHPLSPLIAPVPARPFLAWAAYF
jgi:hypothetical protein